LGPPGAAQGRVKRRNFRFVTLFSFRNDNGRGCDMNLPKGCLLWVLGIPLPVILILYLLFHK
jgi:hypothetical protein